MEKKIQMPILSAPKNPPLLTYPHNAMYKPSLNNTFIYKIIIGTTTVPISEISTCHSSRPTAIPYSCVTISIFATMAYRNSMVRWFMEISPKNQKKQKRKLGYY